MMTARFGAIASPGFPAAATRLRLVLLVAVAVSAYALLWNLSVVRYYGMDLPPAQRAADFVAPPARILQHVLLLPLLIAGYFLASRPFGGAPRSRIVGEQIGLLLGFALLVRPALYLAVTLAPGSAGDPAQGFLEYMDIDSWLSTALNYSLVYVLGLCTLFGLIMLAKYRQEQLRAEAMRANWLQAQLETLRVQLHPHFLFNTLNTISSLVGSQPEEARDLIAQLAALLRDSIEESAGEFYPLGREIELANKYLRIMSVRFGDRLAPAVEVAVGLEECPVPHGILLTLLENAVTHGVSAITGDSGLSLRCTVEAQSLVIEVRNRYDPDAALRQRRRGGLAALARRLNALYGEGCRLEYGGDGAGVWHTRVRLPAELAPAAGGAEGAPTARVMAGQQVLG